MNLKNKKMGKKIQLTETELINLIENMIKEYDGGKFDDDDEHGNEIDIDEVQEILKEKGWGNLPYETFIDFENSDYYSGTLKSKIYARELDLYLKNNREDESYDLYDEGVNINEYDKPAMKSFQKQYGKKKGKSVYYATAKKQGRSPETFKLK